ncbi:MAG TPA: ECF-type sigma factor [Bryobacteraceae bacterium]|nr:ECF-type sigma factor [Bryobacteraceae bacterium]
MEVRAPGELTGLLQSWKRGEQSALNRLIALVYPELRQLAHRHMRAQPLECSLQTTALVNEAYLRLAGAADLSCHDRIHFLAICAQLMRRILVDFARSRGSLKRGGGACRIEFDEALHAGSPRAADVLRLDDALAALARIDERKAKAIELRFFGGLTVEETAEALGVSRETVLRDWRMARAWLKSEIGRARADE